MQARDEFFVKKIRRKRCDACDELAGAGGFASRALKNSPPGCFSPAPGPGRAVLISPAHATSKNPLPGCGRGFLLVGAGGFEPPKQLCNRFTVCPHWPLGNTPTCSALNRVLIYYSKRARKMQAFFSFFRHFFLARQRLGGAFKNSSHLKCHSVV